MYAITELPFFYKSHSKPDNGGEPMTLPFHLYFDDDLKMFRQRPTTDLIKRLVDIYLNGSLVEGSISSESGKVYVDKVIDYIFGNFNLQKDSKILEIGFGSGIILKKIKSKGINNLTGIDPGSHSLVDGLESVHLIKDFFPSNHIKGEFDLIFALLVLEHIENPIEYLHSMISILAEDGKIIIGVPNCEPYINEGDLSMLIHEHFNYFTTKGIIQIISKINFQIEDISIIEGSFIMTISKKGKANNFINKPASLNDYNQKVQSFLGKLSSIVSNYQPNKLAIYAPTRAINALFLINKSQFRLVDDNSELHGHYLPSFSSPVESFDEMAKNPPECVLIFSRTFGERIKSKCKKDNRLKAVRVLTLNDLN